MKREKYDLNGNIINVTNSDEEIAEELKDEITEEANEEVAKGIADVSQGNTSQEDEMPVFVDDDFITSPVRNDNDDRGVSYYSGSQEDVSDYIITDLSDREDFDDGYSRYEEINDSDDDEVVNIDISSHSDYKKENTKKAPKADEQYEYIPRKNSKNKHSNKLIIGAVATVLGLIVIIGGVCVALDNGSKPQDGFVPTTQPITDNSGNVLGDDFTFANGISIGGVDVGGKTLAQVRELAQQVQLDSRTPIDLSVTANGKTAKLTQDDFSYTYNTDEVITLAANYSENSNGTAEKKNFEITAVLDSSSIDKTVDKIAQKIDIKMVQAHVSEFKPFEKDKYVYAEGTKGSEINQETLANDIRVFLSSGKTVGTIAAKTNEISPTITVDMVKKNIVPLSTYSTYSYNTENGTHNMELALSACNGSVIEPGATWSFNKCTGDSNLESNGYKPATVISNGKYEQGIGGGICQASTTIYYAAIYANMDIVERYNHRWASSYAAAGLDATIDYPNLDLKLKNKTSYQMFMECTISGNKLIVNIYGYKDPSYDSIATYSETCDITSETFGAIAYRIFYKDGKEIKREQLPSSTYSLSDGHWVVDGDSGTMGRLPEGAEQNPTQPTTAEQQSPGYEEPETTRPPQTQPPTTKPHPTQPPTTKPQPTTAAPTNPPATNPPETKPEPTEEETTAPVEPSEQETEPQTQPNTTEEAEAITE